MIKEKESKINLLNLSLTELKEFVVKLGEPAYRAGQLFEWLLSGAEFAEMTNLPAAFRVRLSENAVAAPVRVIEELRSPEGGAKLLYALNDGNIIEGALMEYKFGNTLCLSTQAGCRMGCAFCASGIGGLKRNLEAGEMLGQVISVNKLLGGSVKERKLTNLVLMGCGEPLDNYDNVTAFLRLVTAKEGFNFSSRNVSLSTCGIAPKIRRLADDGFSVTLCLSLHNADDAARSEIMPVNKSYSVSETINAAMYYYEKTGRRVIIEYTLISGVNDRKEDAARLIALLKGKPMHVNLIPLNEVEEKSYKGTTRKNAEAFMQILSSHGLSATIRRTIGADLNSACGQLRRKFVGDLDSKNSPK